MRVYTLAAALTAVTVLLAVAGSGDPAWGAVDLDAVINMDVDFAQFRTTYSDRIEYEYGEGSQLHQHLGGRQWVVEGTASEGQDVQNLEDVLNGKIVSCNDSVRISVSDVGYEFRLEPTGYGSVMERTVWITGNLTGYLVDMPIVGNEHDWIPCIDPVSRVGQANMPLNDIQTDHVTLAREGSAPASPLGTRQAGVAYADDYVAAVHDTQAADVAYNLTYVSTNPPSSPAYDTRVNIEWMSPTVTGDVLIDGIPINRPAGLLREMEPEAYNLLAGTRADVILSRPLMDAGPIRQHADTWHLQHYPAGTSVDADTFGLSGGITDVTIRTWVIDVDGPEIGTKGAGNVLVPLDQNYVIRGTHDTSSATIRTIGIGFFETLDGVEAVTDYPSPPRQTVASTQDLQDLSMFIAFILATIIVLMLIVAHRRDRRLQRSDGGQQAGGPP